MSNERGITEDTGTHYRKGGIWYKRCYGGPDTPLIHLGPGSGRPPVRIGPGPDDPLNPKSKTKVRERQQALEKLAKKFDRKG